jgi:SIR2-like domain
MWQEVEEPILVHLHGSVLFGYEQAGFGLVKYSDSQTAGQTLERTRSSDFYVSGQILSATPIISGHNKVAKLSHNPEPYGYYYRAFINSLLGSGRLLVIGYSGRDDYINTWLEQFKKKHQNERRTVWIGCLTKEHAFEDSADKDMIRALSDNFNPAFHWWDANSAEQIFDCGRLKLVPSGFPVSTEMQTSLVEFLKDGT